jgi:hypothetical protein
VRSWIDEYATGDGVEDAVAVLEAVEEGVTAMEGVVEGVAGTLLHVILTEQTDDVDDASTVMLSKYAAPAPRKPTTPI